MPTRDTAVDHRRQDSAFVSQCSFSALRPRLPLTWPTSPDTPPSPKKSYRSHYTYRGCDDLLDPHVWEQYSDFDLILRLVDFSGLRPVLARCLGWRSARGQTPFDPVSFFLLMGWQITNEWCRAQVLRNLRHPCFADYARRFGFAEGCFPTEGGLRYFLTTLGSHSALGASILVDDEQRIAVAVQRLNQLIAQSVQLVRDANLLSPQAWKQALLCPDGMIHPSASRMRCTSVTDTCYQPTSPEQKRPCPAKEKQRRGCNCDSPTCAQACSHAPPRDPQARVVYYEGSNRSTNPNSATTDAKPKGKLFFGYRSLPLQWIDPQRRISLVLADDLLPANAREEVPAAALLHQLATLYPDLQVDAVAGDAAYGYELILKTVHLTLHARRLIDLRSHDTDRNQSVWPIRHYDDKGRPICSYGYAYSANGHDRKRQRHKWICAQACRQGKAPVVRLPDVHYPPETCPYAHPSHPHGHVLNVGLRFADGSLRLVRDLPVGGPAWKRSYHRARNAVEGRNAVLERWDLKRLNVFGHPRAKALIFQADVWHNLTTLARLVREATAATGA